MPGSMIAATAAAITVTCSWVPYGSEVSAQRLRSELAGVVSVPVFVSPVESNGKLLYRVRVGPVADNTELLAVQQVLESGGYGAGQPLP